MARKSLEVQVPQGNGGWRSWREMDEEDGGGDRQREGMGEEHREVKRKFPETHDHQ